MNGNCLVSFWYGALGWIERLCLQSMLDTGHHVAVYSYDPAALKAELRRCNLDVEVRDAGPVLASSRALDRAAAVRPALVSDLIRYELQRTESGTWVDLDVLMLRPMPERDWLMGYTGKWINGAVLKLPADSALLRTVMAFCDRRPVLAPWWSKGRFWQHWVRAKCGFPIAPEDCPWGTFGPKALTYFAEQSGEHRYACAESVFYPVPSAEDLVAPQMATDHFIRNDTVAVHLWANKLRKISPQTPPAPSWLGHQIAKHSDYVP